MKFTLRFQDPFKAGHAVPDNEVNAWRTALTMALSNAHRQTGHGDRAVKFGMPKGKSGVPGLASWLSAHVRNYAWGHRLLSTLTYRQVEQVKAQAPERRKPLAIEGLLITLASPPPFLSLAWSKEKGNNCPRRPGEDYVRWRVREAVEKGDAETNPLVPPGLTRASWLEYRPQKTVAKKTLRR